MIAHEAFFGDAEYTFRLTAPMLKELESKTGFGSLAIFNRIFARQCAVSDLHEVIRCAIIGGGTAPKRAAELVATYAIDRPISEIHPLAVAIAEATWFGRPNENTNGPA